MKKNNFTFNKTNFLLATSLLLPLVTNVNIGYAEAVNESPEEQVTEAIESTELENDENEQTETEEETNEEIIGAEATISLFSKQPAYTYEFINQLAPHAVELGRKYGIYPSVMIAQAALETGWGGQGGGVRDDYVLGIPPNHNLFGIKGNYKGQSVVVTTTEELSNGEIITTKATFKKYPSYRESMEDYANKIRFNQETITWNPYLYKNTWLENSDTYVKALDGLSSWATSSSYKERLNRVIENYSLTQYDLQAFASPQSAADKNYEEIYAVTDGLKNWQLAQQFQTKYPADIRVENILNKGAYDLLMDMKKEYEKNPQKYNVSDLDAIINERIIHNHIREQATLLKEKIQGSQSNPTADDYYKQAMTAYGVSEAWGASQAMKKFFPNDPRLKEVIQKVAERNLIQGKRVHVSGNYPGAVGYYERILAEDQIETAMRNEVLALKKLAENKQKLLSADDYYNQAMNAFGVSDAWEASKAMKAYYSSDSRLATAINRVAERNLIQGKRVHTLKDYNGAVIYYNRVLDEDLVNNPLREQATVLRDLTLAKEEILTADGYYKKAMTAYGVSDAWQASQMMADLYPNDSRLSEVINRVADRNLIQGRRVHEVGKFDEAISYYNRIISNNRVRAAIRDQALNFKKMAENKE